MSEPCPDCAARSKIIGREPPPVGKHLDKLCLVYLHEYGMAMGRAFCEEVRKDIAKHAPEHTCQALGKCYCADIVAKGEEFSHELPCWICESQAHGDSCKACDAASTG